MGRAEDYAREAIASRIIARNEYRSGGHDGTRYQPILQQRVKASLESHAGCCRPCQRCLSPATVLKPLQGSSGGSRLRATALLCGSSTTALKRPWNTSHAHAVA